MGALTESSDINMIELDKAAVNDSSYRSLLTTIITGFSKTRDHLEACLKPFWNVLDCLSFEGNLVYLEDRVVIQAAHQATVLNNLHLPTTSATKHILAEHSSSHQKKEIQLPKLQ